MQRYLNLDGSEIPETFKEFDSFESCTKFKQSKGAENVQTPLSPETLNLFTFSIKAEVRYKKTVWNILNMKPIQFINIIIILQSFQCFVNT